MQNQTPEIQAKLLAMQKHMVQQKTSEVKSIITPASSVVTQVSHQEVVRTTESHDQRATKQRPPLTQEQKEELTRYTWFLPTRIYTSLVPVLCVKMLKNLLSASQELLQSSVTGFL